MSDYHISLFFAAIAGLIAAFLALRSARVRVKTKIIHGDGGDTLMMQRMRAQANFGEYAPFALALIFILDISGRGGWALCAAGAAFFIGRILHALGMDSTQANWMRATGMILTLPVLLGLAIASALAAFKVI